VLAFRGGFSAPDPKKKERPAKTLTLTMQSTEQTCTFLVTADTRPASSAEIKAALESGDPDAVRGALQAAIGALLAGEPLPGLFITLVRYVLPSEDHAVQKLLLLYLVSG
jgi:coatomer subunit beta